MRLCLLLMTVASVCAQDDVVPNPLILRSGQTKVIIPQRDLNGSHDFFSESCRGVVDSSILHFAIVRNGTLYVLFTCLGPSRGGGGNPYGRCGAGVERQINWMAIKGGKVASHQQRDIDSCWRDAVGTISGWKGSKFYWSSEERDGSYECYFDSAEPDKGLQIAKFDSDLSIQENR